MTGNDHLSNRDWLVPDEQAYRSRSEVITPSDLEQVRKRLGNIARKMFFGWPLDEAIDKGFKISPKGVFETVHGEVIQKTASTLSLMLQDIDTPRVLDAFAGTGHASWAFASAGFEVIGVEIHPDTYNHAQENLSLSGDMQVQLLNEDVLSFLQEAAISEKRFDAIYLDPPWDGKYLSKAHSSLKDMTPDGRQLIERCIPLTSIICMKIPPNINIDEVREVSREFKSDALIQEHSISDTTKERRKTLYLIPGGSDVIFI